MKQARRISTRGLAAGCAVLLSACAARGPIGSAPVSATPPPTPTQIRVTGAPNTIPANTKLEVRTNELITSTSPEGRTYSAEIATDVVDQNGQILLPKRTPVELVLMETKQRSGIRGSSVQLGLRSVTLNGATYLVVSEDAQKSDGVGRNTRTVQMVGGGAALGTLIGAATGGGKGAVIGGLAGAAAGALAQILTQGKELRIPAESVLTFQLDEPIRLQPAPAAAPDVQPTPAGSTSTP